MKTIIDVAKAAGVSKSTVSRYLNGEAVREDNRTRIEKAVRALNYRINPIARGLKTSRTYTIGIIIPNLTDIFVTYIIQSCEKVLNASGYSIILCDAEEDAEKEKNRLEFLLGKKVDGIIIEPVSIQGDHIQEVVRIGIPVVLIDRAIPGIECDSVLVDNFSGAYEGMKAIIRYGHQRIGMITGPSHIFTAGERYRGYLSAAEEYGIPIPGDYVQNGFYTRDGGKKAFQELMSLRKRPTAIFISNFYEAIGVMEAIVQMNLCIPQDISLLTFDSMEISTLIDLSAIIKPKISSIRQPMAEMGKKAARCILERLENPVLPSRIFYLSTAMELTDSIRAIED